MASAYTRVTGPEEFMHVPSRTSVTRRASLTAPGAAGLAGLLGPLPAASANPGETKKARRKAKKKCKNQVNQCLDNVSALCNGDEGCLSTLPACCPILADCNFTAFFACASAPRG